MCCSFMQFSIDHKEQKKHPGHQLLNPENTRQQEYNKNSTKLFAYSTCQHTALRSGKGEQRVIHQNDSALISKGHFKIRLLHATNLDSLQPCKQNERALESGCFPAHTGNISVQLYSNTLPTSGSDLFRCSNHTKTVWSCARC